MYFFSRQKLSCNCPKSKNVVKKKQSFIELWQKLNGSAEAGFELTGAKVVLG